MLLSPLYMWGNRGTEVKVPDTRSLLELSIVAFEPWHSSSLRARLPLWGLSLGVAVGLGRQLLLGLCSSRWVGLRLLVVRPRLCLPLALVLGPWAPAGTAVAPLTEKGPKSASWLPGPFSLTARRSWEVLALHSEEETGPEPDRRPHGSSHGRAGLRPAASHAQLKRTAWRFLVLCFNYKGSMCLWLKKKRKEKPKTKQNNPTTENKN